MKRRAFPPFSMLARQWALRFYLGILSVLVMALAEPNQLSILIGVGITCVGLILRLWVRGYRSTAAHFPDYGPYRFSRHPFYLGSFFAMLGLSLACRSALALGAAMLMTLVLFPLILREEDQHQREDEAAFKAYRAQVPRFLPSLVPSPSSPQAAPPYSLAFALLAPESREINTLLLFAVAFIYQSLLWLYQAQLGPWRWAAASALGLFLIIRYARQCRLERRANAKG